MGRGTKLTPELTEKVCADIRAGLPIARAALAAGISEPTFYRWMEKGDPNTNGEPDLSAMPTKSLRAIAVAAEIPLKPRTTREQVLTALTDAGEGSWEPYRQFRKAVEAADLDLERRLAAQVQTASAPRMENGVVVDPGKPHVLLTMLARRFKHWSPTHQVEVSGPDGEPVPIEVRAKAIAESAAAFRSAGEPETSEGN